MAISALTRLLKRLVLGLILTSVCAAQQAKSPAACPLKVAVAATNVPFRDGSHIVVWFQNLTEQPVSRASFQLSLIDSSSQRHPARQEYVLDSLVNPGQAGVMTEPALKESQAYGRTWKSVRGLEVTVKDVAFADGTTWTASQDPGCQESFLNADYEPSMRAWNAELRAEWNQRHPGDPMPGPSLSAWLLPHSEGWR
jgi:hypothetical protein